MDVSLTVKFMFALKWLPQDSYDDVLYALYEALLIKLKSKGMRVVDHIYEKDKNGLLHLHAHARLDKKIYGAYCQAWKDRYDTFRMKGFSIDIDVIKSLPGWKKYMLKDHGTDKYFKQGTSLSPKRSGELYENAARAYEQCIQNEINELERLRRGFN